MIYSSLEKLDKIINEICKYSPRIGILCTCEFTQMFNNLDHMKSLIPINYLDNSDESCNNSLLVNFGHFHDYSLTFYIHESDIGVFSLIESNNEQSFSTSILYNELNKLNSISNSDIALSLSDIENIHICKICLYLPNVYMQDKLINNDAIKFDPYSSILTITVPEGGNIVPYLLFIKKYIGIGEIEHVDQRNFDDIDVAIYDKLFAQQ